MGRSRLRRVMSSVLAASLLVSSVFFTDVVRGTQAAAHSKIGVTNSGKGVVQTGSGESGNGEESSSILVEDSQESGVYYNSNSALQDFRDETIYFVMTTRFYDGDSSNNVQCWDGTGYNGDETPWKGDFKGLIEKLDYIKALGFTAIWITPVVKNASGYDYHGYHALNFKEVDSRYESDDCTYQDLIDAVHARGMKIIQDVVFNHTGNFGEENLLPLFSRDEDANLAEITECMVPNPAFFPPDYFSLEPGLQYESRLDYMKDLNGTGKDEKNLWHHFGNFNWDDYTCQLAQIAGDCVDLNTENPIVYKYLVEAYGEYIKMGVDAFRVDTVRHMSRLSLNKGFISQLNDIYNDVHGTTGERNFFMFGEVCTRYSSVWYREVPALSTPFYTWKESKDYPWIDDENNPDAYATNMESAEAHYNDNSTAADIAKQPTSDNAFLNGNEYHTPDYSQSSGLDVIDFPMHWNFKEATGAYNIAVSSDKYYNDATYNVVYVDSHDYAPDHAPEDERYAGSREQWAENLSLMFTFRGIPCIYYGSEVEFMKGAPIDKGPNIALNETGRAYFGDLIEGSVDVADFARYDNATGNIADTLNHPLSLHIQRLNRLRASVPALRKGQYSTEGCKGKFAYKRRYTDAETDSFALIALTEDATFTGIPNGTYTDAITGDVKNVTGGTLATSGISGKGDLRVYVLDTALTKAPGLIEGHSDFMSGEGGDVTVNTIKPTGITITGDTTASLDLGESFTFKAQVTPEDATNKIVTWSSGDPSVAVVSGNGKVTAKGEGTATIYAATCNAQESDYTNSSKLVATAKVTVKAEGIKVTSIVVNKKAVSLEEGEAEKITTTILPGNASPNYTALSWKSADSSIAKVNSNGIITAVKAGKTTITVCTVSGVSETIVVEVKAAVVHGNAIYFKKPAGWGNKVFAYLWTKDENGKTSWQNKGWPGEAMLLVDEDEGVYGVSWPEGKSDLNVVFSDGNTQSDDLKPVLNACIDSSGTMVKEEIPTNPPKPTDESTKPSDESTKPSDESTKPSDESTKPSDESTKPSDESTKPSEESTKPSEESTKPGDESTKPSNESTKPSDESTKPGDESTKPSDESTKPGEESTKPGDESTKPSDESTKPSDESTKPSDESTKPNEDPTEPVGDLGIKSFTASVASGMLEKGKTVRLKASAVNGQGTVKYRFTVKRNNSVTTIRNYSARTYVNWKPVKSGKYTFTVYAKDDCRVVKKKISNYTVNDTLKITGFKASVKSKKARAGKKIILTSKASGGTKSYMYKYSYKLGENAKTISNYSKKSAVSWIPKKAGTYELRVYVKDAKTGKVVKRTIKKYVVKRK